jgi:hypothetical protein
MNVETGVEAGLASPPGQGAGRKASFLLQAGERIGLTVFSLVLALAGLEVCLRLFPLRQDDPLADRPAVFYRMSPERNHPWTIGVTNALRIVIIGDSFTDGVGVQIDERYGAQLERMLNLNGGVMPAEVRIRASSGTSTFQQVDILRKAMAEYRPHVVILGICLNDTEDWADPDRVWKWLNEWIFMSTSKPSPWMESCLRHSRVLALVHGRVRAVKSHIGIRKYYHKLYDPNYSGFHRFADAIREFRDICATNQVPLLPVVFPLLSNDMMPGRYPFQFAHDRIRGVMETNGLPYLDLINAFASTSPQRMQAVPGIDPHPSEMAHQVAAEAILNELIDRKLIPKAYTPRVYTSMQGLRGLWERKIRALNHEAPPAAPGKGASKASHATHAPAEGGAGPGPASLPGQPN